MALLLSRPVWTKSVVLTKTIVFSNILQLFFVIPLTTAQHDCSKYCWDSCSDYFGGSEFSPCVSANVHCNCISKMNIKNPLTIFLIVASIMIGIAITVCCYARSRRGRAPSPNRVLAEPVISTVHSSHINMMSSPAPHQWDYSHPNHPNHHTDSYIPPPSYDACQSHHDFSSPTSHSYDTGTCSAPSAPSDTGTCSAPSAPSDTGCS